MISRRALLLTFMGVPMTATNVTATGFAVTGHFTDAGDEGMYALGQELALIAKPGTVAHKLLNELVGAEVCMSVRKGECA